MIWFGEGEWEQQLESDEFNDASIHPGVARFCVSFYIDSNLSHFFTFFPMMWKEAIAIEFIKVQKLHITTTNIISNYKLSLKK